MSTFIIIIACLLFAAALASLSVLPRWQALAPVLSYLGLAAVSLARRDGVQLLPVNSSILMGWLCMTLVVMAASALQPAAVRRASRGTGYILVGALAGLSVGLLGFTVSAGLSLLYGIMITAVAVGVFFGYLLFTNTPAGAGVNFSSGKFFSYLLAKGFPAAITVMQAGVVLVLALALHNASNP